MSRNLASLSDKPTAVGNGYLTVENHPVRPMEVVFSWDVPTSTTRSIDCRATTCKLRIRFSTGAVIEATAVQQSLSPWQVVLRSGQEFISLATKQSGPIEVEFPSLQKEPATFRFSTSSTLQLAKLRKLQK